MLQDFYMNKKTIWGKHLKTNIERHSNKSLFLNLTRKCNVGFSLPFKGAAIYYGTEGAAEGI